MQTHVEAKPLLQLLSYLLSPPPFLPSSLASAPNFPPHLFQHWSLLPGGDCQVFLKSSIVLLRGFVKLFLLILKNRSSGNTPVVVCIMSSADVPCPILPPVFDWLYYGKRREKAYGVFTKWSLAQASHVITLVCIAMLQRRSILHSVLATKTRRRQWRTTSSVQNISKLEEIAQKGRQMMCEKSAVKI